MFRLDLNTDTKLTIPSAGAARPFLQTYRPSLEWLLDIADGAVPNHTAATGRLRGALRELAAGGGARVNTRDLKLAGAMMLAAIERDLGRVLAVASNRGNLDRHDQAGFERRDGFGLLIAA